MKALLYGLLVGAILAYSAPLLTTAEELDGETDFTTGAEELMKDTDVDTAPTVVDVESTAFKSVSSEFLFDPSKNMSSTTIEENNANSENQFACGIIRYPAGVIHKSKPYTTQLIYDCDDPFNLTDDTYPYTLRIGGEAVLSGDLITVPAAGTSDYILHADQNIIQMAHTLYRHGGGAYQYEAVFFEDTVNGGLFFRNVFGIPWPVLSPGTYTLVTTEVTDEAWRDISRNSGIFRQSLHKANNFHAITFTLEAEEEELSGASSVLFLPGIMGSALYEESDENDTCTGSGERRRWTSRFACAQLRLLTNFRGQSINDIYTKEDDSAVVDETLGLNLYKSFISDMNDLEGAMIADFTPYAYDWRLRLDDLLKTRVDDETGKVYYDAATPLTEGRLYSTVEKLIEDSYSGKLTIVAHSNGGLLAKTFLSALQATDDPLLEKIDNLILVGSPQAGTPDAVSSMLHGSSIAGGFLVTAQTSRTLLNTAPFGHHLLPSQLYFGEAGSGVTVESPVVVFEPGVLTDSWQSEYGESISDVTTLRDFLSTNSGRTKPAVDDLHTPEVVDPFLLTYANTIANVQASWTPPPSITVHQIAGTGVSTVSGVTYSTGSKCVRSGSNWFQCQYEPVLKNTINHTYDGDQTVVVPSALAMKESENVQRWWVDLFEYGDDNFINITHKNIMELGDVKNLITSIINTDSIPILEYSFQNEISLDIGELLEFQLHSPLDMTIESDVGTISSTTVSIPGATYRRYGEVQYISLPIQNNPYELVLQGYEVGSFTLDVTKRDADTIIDTYSYTAVPTSTSTLVSLPLANLSASSTLDIDFDGDGTIDGVVKVADNTPSAIEVMVPVDEVVDEVPETVQPRRSTSGTRVRVPAPAGEVAGVSSTAEEVITEEDRYITEMMRLLNELQVLLSELEKMYEN